LRVPPSGDPAAAPSSVGPTGANTRSAPRAHDSAGTTVAQSGSVAPHECESDVLSTQDASASPVEVKQAQLLALRTELAKAEAHVEQLRTQERLQRKMLRSLTATASQSTSTMSYAATWSENRPDLVHGVDNATRRLLEAQGISPPAKLRASPSIRTRCRQSRFTHGP